MKSHTLFVYPDAHWRHFNWLELKQGERGPLQQGTLEECQHWRQSTVSATPGLVLILPVESALHTVVTVPRKQRRFLARSLPFILEAQTAQDIDELHIVPGDNLTGDLVGVLAVPHRIMDKTRAVATQLDVALVNVVLDSQLLQYNGTPLCLAWQENRILVNAGGRGLACRRNDVMFWLERAWPDQDQKDAGPIDTVLLASPDRLSEAATLQAELAQQTGSTNEPQVTAVGWLPMLVDRWIEHAPRTTLLTGPYERKDRFSAWRRFVPTVALAGGLLIAASGLFFWQELQRTEARADATWDAVEATFLAATPEGFSFNRHQFRQTAEALVARSADASEGDSHFMITLAGLNAAINGRAVELEEIRYTGAGQEAQLQVTAASTGELEAFRDALEAAAFSVTYSAGRVGTGFRGNYRLQSTSGGN